MFFKKEKIENKIFEKSNEKAYHDLIYILGSKKEIIKRNLLGGIARGVGIRNRSNYSNSNNSSTSSKNSNAKHSSNRRIYI